jgi:peptide chain release factor subunit 1
VKVSLLLPEGAADHTAFVRNEIVEAQNIKSKETRKAVISGLRKIALAIKVHTEKVALYTDGDELLIEPYEGRNRIYHCGREYKRPAPEFMAPYLLIVVDANEATIGITDGEHIRVLWSDESFVPRKHDKGGQSERRFERGREEALKHWLRKILDIVLQYHENRQLIVAGPGMTKMAFVKEMPDWLANKVIRTESVGYTTENGLWELMGKSRYV